MNAQPEFARYMNLPEPSRQLSQVPKLGGDPEHVRRELLEIGRLVTRVTSLTREPGPDNNRASAQVPWQLVPKLMVVRLSDQELGRVPGEIPKVGRSCMRYGMLQYNGYQFFAWPVARRGKDLTLRPSSLKEELNQQGGHFSGPEQLPIFPDQRRYTSIMVLFEFDERHNFVAVHVGKGDIQPEGTIAWLGPVDVLKPEADEPAVVDVRRPGSDDLTQPQPDIVLRAQSPLPESEPPETL